MKKKGNLNVKATRKRKKRKSKNHAFKNVARSQKT